MMNFDDESYLYDHRGDPDVRMVLGRRDSFDAAAARA